MGQEIPDVLLNLAGIPAPHLPRNRERCGVTWSQRLRASCVPAHQIDQILDRIALLSRRAGLHRYAVPDPVAVIQKIRKSGPAGTLRRCQHTPKANGIHITDIVLQCFHIVYCSRIHTPIVLVIFKIGFLPIDQSAKTHLAIVRDKELGVGIYIFHSIIDISQSFLSTSGCLPSVATNEICRHRSPADHLLVESAHTSIELPVPPFRVPSIGGGLR